MQIKNTEDEALKLASLMSQKIANWEKRNLSEVASLSKNIRALVLNFSKNLATGHPVKEKNSHQSSSSACNSYATAARTTLNVSKTQPTLSKISHKPSQQEKPSHIFLCLLKDHSAHQTSPHATMDILRKHLDRTCATAVKEIQQMPSSLAIWPRDGLGLHLLTKHKKTLKDLVQRARTEIEQNWTIFALLNTP